MKEEHKIILELLSSYLDKNPEQRFGQAIFNLGINEFQNNSDLKNPNYNLRDIHNDKDTDVIERIKNQLIWLDSQSKIPE
ncbi:hypothetical protein [Flavobacterium cerinum]|uniref:Uncharacterized protein n=1 Tax=Flavobacterium cerinum TaxID=2502784 RepID=A0A3S3QM42_9FLAO|nr:hypothetical protein [Flavobacterium cerinum]RWX02233.1 hypothetical protein EPI11_03175 [Flavobacterium cerinum]